MRTRGVKSSTCGQPDDQLGRRSGRSRLVVLGDNFRKETKKIALNLCSRMCADSLHEVKRFPEQTVVL
jgi:hypothetical protein